MTSNLTITDALALTALVEAARGTKPVARVDEDNRITRGLARSIVTEHGHMSWMDKDNVDNLVLHVTTEGGWEAFWSLRTLIAEIKVGTFVVNPA